MNQQGPQSFWTDLLAQRHVMETNGARNPTAVLSGSPDDPAQLVTPASPRRCQSDSLLDGEKAGATLLLAGVFLAMVGVTFTTMGWQHNLDNSNFEWTQLLGPILISVGGTFIFTSVCKFGIISCWPCRQWEEDVVVTPAMEQTSARHSFTLSCINQQSMLQGTTTTMVCIPPMYNFVTQEVRQGIDFQPGRSVNGILAALPPPDTVFCVDNAAFTAAEEDETAQSTGTDCRTGRTKKTEDERGRGDESGSTCSCPPAYDDIYPSFNKHNPT